MTAEILSLLNALDEALASRATEGEVLNLYQIGASALVLHCGRTTSTSDIDFLQMHAPLEHVALELFGRESPAAREFGVYLDIVPQGLPPVPNRLRSRCVPIDGPWKIIRLWRPEWNDFAATKLKRFSAKDRADLQFLCDEGLLDRKELRASLESAFLWVHEKDDDPDRDRAFANLERIEQYLEGKTRQL